MNKITNREQVARDTIAAGFPHTGTAMLKFLGVTAEYPIPENNHEVKQATKTGGGLPATERFHNDPDGNKPAESTGMPVKRKNQGT